MRTEQYAPSKDGEHVMRTRAERTLFLNRRRTRIPTTQYGELTVAREDQGIHARARLEYRPSEGDVEEGEQSETTFYLDGKGMGALMASLHRPGMKLVMLSETEAELLRRAIEHARACPDASPDHQGLAWLLTTVTAQLGEQARLALDIAS